MDFEIAARAVPPGWTRTVMEDWLVYTPDDAMLPPQGWKVHVSACLSNADKVLAAVFPYCVQRRLCFKFIRSRQLLLLRNGKYADRGSSGKFMALYPADESELESVLTELEPLVAGQAGPYILSDLRWGAGPLYVRYGGFAERYCVGPNGELTLAIADGEGRLVPDNRGPTFRPPDWIIPPSFLAPHLGARAGTTIDELPYTIDSVLHFSNGGGIYSGTDRGTGAKVILKEARPHAGLDTSGADAVERLYREVDVLRRLAGLDCVAQFRDLFTLDNHAFLVQDFIDGEPLNSVIVNRYPLVERDPDPGRVKEYTDWAVDLLTQVEAAVEAVNDRGIVIGDFHPSNVLIGPDNRVTLIDFEVAGDEAEGRRPTLADPGFLAPADRAGFEIDRYALACLRLYVFLPLTNLFVIEPEKAEDLAREIVEAFPVPSTLVEEAVRVIRGSAAAPSSARRRAWPRLDPTPAGWKATRESMRRAILMSATPCRQDRLFPGDVKQFVTGGLNLAHGAAGVLYAMAATGCPRVPELEGWLTDRVVRPEPGSRLGFYDGLHGVAYALEYLSWTAEARKVLDICRDELDGKGDRLSLDLQSGLAGVGLNLLHFATAVGDPSLATEARAVAELVALRLGDAESVSEHSGGELPYAGLLRGSSGPALLFIRLYEQTGDTALLDVALTAIQQDLRRCYLRDDGSLEVNEGWRTMPYLADGSVGIGMVLAEYLAHRDDAQLAEASRAIRKAAEAQFYIEPGLFYGRAGMILFLSRSHGAGAAAQDPVVASHIRRLAWHALTYEGELAFPGEQLLRLSMDLATGTAGVLLSVGAALHETPVHLPFLGPASSHDPHANRKGGDSRWQFSTCKA